MAWTPRWSTRAHRALLNIPSLSAAAAIDKAVQSLASGNGNAANVRAIVPEEADDDPGLQWRLYVPDAQSPDYYVRFTLDAATTSMHILGIFKA